MSERNPHVPSRFSLRRNSGATPTTEVAAPEPLVRAQVGTGGYQPESHDTTTFETGGYELEPHGGSDGAVED